MRYLLAGKVVDRLADDRGTKLLTKLVVLVPTQKRIELARYHMPKLFISQPEIVSAHGPQRLPCQLGAVAVF